jgi:hypothetical protein
MFHPPPPPPHSALSTLSILFTRKVALITFTSGKRFGLLDRAYWQWELWNSVIRAVPGLRMDPKSEQRLPERKFSLKGQEKEIYDHTARYKYRIYNQKGRICARTLKTTAGVKHIKKNNTRSFQYSIRCTYPACKNISKAWEHPRIRSSQTAGF